MRLVEIARFGGPEVLAMVERPSLPLEPGEVRLAVRAINLNRADVLLRQGAYHQAILPQVPGREGAGVVRELGAAVAGFAIGQRVLAFAGRPGFYSDEVVAPASALLAIPEGVSDGAASALPTAWLTAFYCLVDLARTAPGETVLVQAAASGVGHAAVQIARALGARVIGACGSDEKAAFVRSLGADEVVNYERQDLSREIARLTGGQGVAVVIDGVGGALFPHSLRALGYRGRLIAFGNPSRADSLMNVRDFYPKNVTIQGFQLGFLRERDGYDPRPALAALLARLADGSYRVAIDRVFPLEEVKEAHRYLEDRRNRGQVILAPRRPAP